MWCRGVSPEDIDNPPYSPTISSDTVIYSIRSKDHELWRVHKILQKTSSQTNLNHLAETLFTYIKHSFNSYAICVWYLNINNFRNFPRVCFPNWTFPNDLMPWWANVFLRKRKNYSRKKQHSAKASGKISEGEKISQLASPATSNDDVFVV